MISEVDDNMSGAIGTASDVECGGVGRLRHFSLALFAASCSVSQTLASS